MIKEMYKAVTEGDVESVKAFIQADPTILNKVVMRHTWLNHAITARQLDIVKLLVSRGLSVNSDLGVDHPLKTAANRNAIEIADFLLCKGADVNGRENKNAPPLAGAIHSGSIDLVKLFLDQGATTEVVWGDSTRFTPISFAKSFGESHLDIVRLLEKYSDGSLNDMSVHSDEVIAHLQQCFGPVELLLCNEVVTGLPISVHIVRVKGTKPYAVLATSGMSSKAMRVPEGAEQYEFAELLMYLPADWPVEKDIVNDAKYDWPIEWLRRIANFPHENNTWIGWPSATFTNGEPPEPFSENTGLDSFLVLDNSDDMPELINSKGNRVQFYEMYPIYMEELNLINDKGVDALLDKFEEYQIPMTVDVKRRNVASL